MRLVVVCVCLRMPGSALGTRATRCLLPSTLSVRHSTTYTTRGRIVKAVTEVLESQKHKLLQETEEL